ncbi:hypothetical protein GCM10022224_040160 [Nonomuraea antimicrobica]|uniref:Methyltransferase domain-containing protein n=1 Tax=Nonomuraea antimicrobica TaxID=561173 RepID=A0ABP7BWL7_9ACTN
MTDIVSDDRSRAVADIYNSTVAAWAISAAWEVGLLDELDLCGELKVEQFAEDHDLDLRSTIGLLRSLAAVHVVERGENTVRVGANFEEVLRNRAFFHWLCRGSAALFTQIPHVMRNENRTGEFFERDAAAIAFACREINIHCYDPAFLAALDRVDFDVTTVADLGCGSGGRVIQLSRRYPKARTLGIDIARPSLAVAASDVEAAGLADRVTLIEADVLDLPNRPDFAEVELLTCFMMGHDFWPKERCVPLLRGLREAFPNVRRFVLGDATRTVGVPDDRLPVFTLGFEFGHDLMGVYLPTVEEWESAFAESGWRVVERNLIDIAVGEVVFELEPVGER